MIFYCFVIAIFLYSVKTTENRDLSGRNHALFLCPSPSVFSISKFAVHDISSPPKTRAPFIHSLSLPHAPPCDLTHTPTLFPFFLTPSESVWQITTEIMIEDDAVMIVTVILTVTGLALFSVFLLPPKPSPCPHAPVYPQVMAFLFRPSPQPPLPPPPLSAPLGRWPFPFALSLFPTLISSVVSNPAPCAYHAPLLYPPLLYLPPEE